MSDNLLLSGHSASPIHNKHYPLTFLLLQFHATYTLLAVSEGWQYFFSVHVCAVFSPHSRNSISLGARYDGLNEQWWSFLCSSRNPKQKPAEELHFPFLPCSRLAVNGGGITCQYWPKGSRGCAGEVIKLLWGVQGRSQTLLWPFMPLPLKNSCKMTKSFVFCQNLLVLH